MAGPTSSLNWAKLVAWSCVNLAGTTAKGGTGKSFQRPGNWGIQLKAMIREGEDPSILEVVNATNFAQFSAEETVKGWSLCDFLMSDHKKKFIQLMDTLRTDEKMTAEVAFKKVFKWSLEDLNQNWKSFALANYE